MDEILSSIEPPKDEDFSEESKHRLGVRKNHFDDVFSLRPTPEFVAERQLYYPFSNQPARDIAPFNLADEVEIYLCVWYCRAVSLPMFSDLRWSWPKAPKGKCTS